MGKSTGPKITIRGDMYSLDVDGRTEIADLAEAVRRNRTEVLEAFVAAGIPRSRINRLRGRRKATKRTRPAAASDPKVEFAVALEAGSLPRVRKLLAAGADPDARLPNGYRPLMLAALGGHAGLVRELLSQGANPRRTNPGYRNAWGGRGGATALSFAILKDRWTIAERLLADGQRARKSAATLTALFTAAGAKSPRYLERLIDRGFKPGWIDGDGCTALHVAAGYGAVANVKRLIGCGLDPDGRDGNRDTPLHRAVLNRRTANARALLCAGADPSLKDRSRQTPLVLARAGEAPAALIKLLEQAS